MIIAGAEFTGGGGAALLPPRAAQVIFMTSNPLDLGKQIWADVGLIGHPRENLRELLQALETKPHKPRPHWVEAVNNFVGAFRAQLKDEQEKPASTAYESVTVPEVICSVHEIFGPDAVILDHSTTGTSYMLDMLPLDNPQRYFGITGRASAQGWGAPAAIGVQIALPDRQVVAIVGDGGFMFTSNTFYAAAAWNVPVKLIVLANGGWHDVAYSAKHSSGWTDREIRDARWIAEPKVDFAGMAASFGIEGRRANTRAGLNAALVQARDSSDPFMVEVETDPAAIDYYVRWVTR